LKSGAPADLVEQRIGGLHNDGTSEHILSSDGRALLAIEQMVIHHVSRRILRDGREWSRVVVAFDRNGSVDVVNEVVSPC
jgi:hypothetical protein